jgi:hypothetical protein
MPLPRGFMGSRPVSLRSLPAIAEWLTTVEAASPPGSAANGPLAQVRDLSIQVPHLEAPDLVRLLRAAPQVRRLTINPERASTKHIPEAVFAELVHLRLRHLIVERPRDPRFDTEPAVDCGILLRQRSLPRLRRLTVNGQEYPVSMTD